MNMRRVLRHKNIMLVNGNLCGFEHKLLWTALTEKWRVGGYIAIDQPPLGGEFIYTLVTQPERIRKKNMEFADITIYFRLVNKTKESRTEYDMINPSAAEIADFFWRHPDATRIYVNGTPKSIRFARSVLRKFYRMKEGFNNGRNRF